MSRLPRVAVGSIQLQVDPGPVAWGMMDALSRSGWQVQHFLSPGRFAVRDAAHPITGLASRQVDSWLMSASLCQELFWHGARTCDVAVVEGQFHRAASDALPKTAGSCFHTICDWLNLPCLAAIDVSLLHNCCLPQLPKRVCGLLLDRFRDEQDYRHWQTLLEPLWGVPVLGGLPQVPRLRKAIAELPRGAELPRKLCLELGEQFAVFADVPRLRALAAQREFTPPQRRLFQPVSPGGPLRVAVAYDAAFRCYFPDTLDLLEARGADLVEFSPLRDEDLPPDVDIVYLGCGHPERYASQLSGNYCMTSALRTHVCEGRRIYAEGGGLAYLCTQIAWPDGYRSPMTGVLPAVAHFHPHAPPAHPAEVHLAVGNWLGPAGTRLRGYVNNQWTVSAGEDLSTLAAELEQSSTDGRSSHDGRQPPVGPIVGRHHAIGSRMHLNFATQPELLPGFFRPHAACLELARVGVGHGKR